MTQLLTSEHLLSYQIEHYSHRLSEAKTIEERMFLRGELYNLKQRLQSLLN